MNPRTIRVAGLDPSLRRTGVAVLACTPSDRWSVHSFDVPTTGARSDTEADTLDRMTYIVGTVMATVDTVDAVGIEGPAYSARGAATHDLAGLWWMCFRRLLQLELPTVIIPPTTAKAYATGRGNADKRDMSRACLRMWPDHNTSSGDQDDALVLASAAADLCGLAVPYERTDYRRTALGRMPAPPDLPDYRPISEATT